MKEEKMRLVKLVIWGATTLSITYLGYNLFSGEVMTTIDNWIATGTLTLAQISNALIIILTRVLPANFANQVTPTLTNENAQIKAELQLVKNELLESRKENALILQTLNEMIEYRENAIQEA